MFELVLLLSGVLLAGSALMAVAGIGTPLGIAALLVFTTTYLLLSIAMARRSGLWGVARAAGFALMMAAPSALLHRP